MRNVRWPGENVKLVDKNVSPVRLTLVPIGRIWDPFVR
jgi:hypothetical protein